MKGKFNFKLGALCAILSAMLVMPALGQAEGEGGAIYKEKRDQLIKELKSLLLKKRRQYWRWKISMRESAKKSSTA